MSFALLRQGMLHVAEALRPVLQVENVLIDEAERAVSWRNRRSGIIRGTYYPLEYQALLDSQQYSFLLADGSFFQFFYAFRDDDLRSARIAYYPSPLGTNDRVESLLGAAEGALERADEDLYEHLFNSAELLELHGRAPVNTSHIRFDFDPNAHAAHSPAHIQYGAINDLRLPANFVPLPMAFLELILPILQEGVARPMTAMHLNFARNHVHDLAPLETLISLSHLRA